MCNMIEKTENGISITVNYITKSFCLKEIDIVNGEVIIIGDNLNLEAEIDAFAGKGFYQNNVI